jgi:hypothetical protein
MNRVSLSLLIVLDWKNHNAFEHAFAQPSLRLRLDRPAGKRFAHLDFVGDDVRSL